MRRVISDYFVLAPGKKRVVPKLDCARRLDIVHCPLNIYLKGTQMRASNGAAARRASEINSRTCAWHDPGVAGRLLTVREVCRHRVQTRASEGAISDRLRRDRDP
ncbi:hypothetical protein ALC57_03454 [Trachymyrmex cornetzi]|uniref:Uncharacterized protein n=1 Tax=Trachymyrmex cornetzi TaxID=471704 RepID=A0A195EG19_9HYME|nr:hypothetical protein ALC57_03454 [Trachymyrmex cornetzi]